MSAMIQWVAVHHHSNGSDAVLFKAPADIYRRIPLLGESEILKEFVDEFLPEIEFEPEQGESLDLASVTDAGHEITVLQIAKLAARLPEG